jgi:hypothetical protein
VESFYLHKSDAVTLVAMFAAFVERAEVMLSEEHDDFMAAGGGGEAAVLVAPECAPR